MSSAYFSSSPSVQSTSCRLDVGASAKIPMQTFLDAMPMMKEKMIAA
jgi:hypothetical protein